MSFELIIYLNQESISKTLFSHEIEKVIMNTVSEDKADYINSNTINDIFLVYLYKGIYQHYEF